MKPKLDDLTVLIANAGLDLRKVSFEEVLALITREAQLSRGRAMASVKLGKAPWLVTIDEAVAALRNPETLGDRDLTARTWRAGEIAYQDTLVERGLYDERLAEERATTNIDLDEGEVTIYSTPSPTKKRPSHRPARSKDFAKGFAVDVEYRRAAGEGPSYEKVVEKMTGRDRDGRPIAGIVPSLILPAGCKSHRTLMNILRSAARNAPSLIKEAQEQGELVRAGKEPDAVFMDKLLKVRDLIANPKVVKSMLRAERRKN